MGKKSKHKNLSQYRFKFTHQQCTHAAWKGKSVLMSVSTNGWCRLLHSNVCVQSAVKDLEYRGLSRLDTRVVEPAKHRAPENLNWNLGGAWPYRGQSVMRWSKKHLTANWNAFLQPLYVAWTYSQGGEFSAIGLFTEQFMTLRASFLAYNLKETWPLNTYLCHIASLLLESGVRAITSLWNWRIGNSDPFLWCQRICVHVSKRP